MTCKERCRNCAYLIEGDNGEWICDDWSKDIHEVDNDDCELTKYDKEDTDVHTDFSV